VDQNTSIINHITTHETTQALHLPHKHANHNSVCAKVSIFYVPSHLKKNNFQLQNENHTYITSEQYKQQKASSKKHTTY
jgi:hypothetical protein